MMQLAKPKSEFIIEKKKKLHPSSKLSYFG